MVSNILLTADVTVIDKQICEIGYGIGTIRTGMFCAGVPEGGKDACQVSFTELKLTSTFRKSIRLFGNLG